MANFFMMMVKCKSFTLISFPVKHGKELVGYDIATDFDSDSMRYIFGSKANMND